MKAIIENLFEIMLFIGIMGLFSGVFMAYGPAMALMTTGGITIIFSISMIFFEAIAIKRG